MSLYNMLFGESGAADALLAALGSTRENFYRFRDCYLTEKLTIAVYTRGGGNNRQCYCDDRLAGAKPDDIIEWHHEKHLSGCVRILHAEIRRHPCYLYDEDDDFDNTYATFYFRIPDNADHDAIAALLPEMDRDQCWQIALEALKKTMIPPAEHQ